MIDCIEVTHDTECAADRPHKQHRNVPFLIMQSEITSDQDNKCDECRDQVAECTDRAYKKAKETSVIDFVQMFCYLAYTGAAT